jgi:hypothetical protein
MQGQCENGNVERMNSHTGEPLEEMSSDVAEQPFRLLTIFDSAEANAEAASASKLILNEVGEDVLVDKSAWDVRLLDSAVLRGRAAEQAANADVIVLALSSREPSEPLRQWLDEWQKQRKLDGGLLAFIPAGDAKGEASLAEFCNEAAITANMDFLCRKQPRF